MEAATFNFGILCPDTTAAAPAHRRSRNPLPPPQNPKSKPEGPEISVHLSLRDPRVRVVRILSARVQLVYFRKVGPLRGVYSDFYRDLAFFTCFLTVFDCFQGVFQDVNARNTDPALKPFYGGFKKLNLGSLSGLQYYWRPESYPKSSFLKPP